MRAPMRSVEWMCARTGGQLVRNVVVAPAAFASRIALSTRNSLFAAVRAGLAR